MSRDARRSGDDLDPARGCAIALGIAVALWLVIAAIVLVILR